MHPRDTLLVEEALITVDSDPRDLASWKQRAWEIAEALLSDDGLTERDFLTQIHENWLRIGPRRALLAGLTVIVSVEIYRIVAWAMSLEPLLCHRVSIEVPAVIRSGPPLEVVVRLLSLLSPLAEEGQSKRPVVWFDDLVIDIVVASGDASGSPIEVIG